MFRSLLIAALFAAALVPTQAATAEEIHSIVFPVAGENHYSDTWGAPRSGGRTHEGTDIMADKMVPVVAAASGTVGWMNDEQGGDCCAMALYHDDGWTSWYIHMNNDTPGTDDGLGWGFADGITTGVHVEAGQLIGWVGDSGNAEWTNPHIHFELHDEDGTPINPYPHLVAAQESSPGLLDRLAGVDRFETAAAASEATFAPGVDTVFVAFGLNFPDAIAGGAAAGVLGSPVLLTRADSVPSYTLDELTRLGPRRIVLLGGTAVIEEHLVATFEGYADVVERWFGPDRYGTAAMISEATYPSGATTVYLADGLAFEDALSAAPAAAANGAPLLLANGATLHSWTMRELQRLSPTEVIVLGPDTVIEDALLTEIEALLPGVVVRRVSGGDAFATGALISAETWPTGAATVHVATTNAFADGLAGAPVAAAAGGPILLVDSDALPADTQSELERLGAAEVVILGGVGAVSADVETAIWDLEN